MGTSYSEVVPASGRLYLGYNDEVPAFSDNSGAFTVILVTTPPGACGPSKAK